MRFQVFIARECSVGSDIYVCHLCVLPVMYGVDGNTGPPLHLHYDSQGKGIVGAVREPPLLNGNPFFPLI